MGILVFFIVILTLLVGLHGTEINAAFVFKKHR